MEMREMTKVTRTQKILNLLQENRLLRVENEELKEKIEYLRDEVTNLALEIQMLRSSSGEWVLTGNDG